MKLTVYLQHDRAENGILILDGLYVCPCLGQSDQAKASDSGNPSRDPLKQFGDIPTGSYKARIIPASGPGRSYGPWKRLYLYQGVSGDAAKALTEDKAADGTGGRYNILVHGGALGASKATDTKPAALWLRPTYGCLRLSNDDMGKLVKLIEAAGVSIVDLEIIQLEITDSTAATPAAVS